MIFQKGLISEFEAIKDFYWNLIDEMEEEVLIPHALAVTPKQQGCQRPCSMRIRDGRNIRCMS